MAFNGNTWYTYLIYSIIVLIAILGNSLALYVFFTRSSYLKNTSKMFLCSLAITDIITVVMLVFSPYLYLPQIPEGDINRAIFCKTIWLSWIVFTLGYISIYTCLTLAIERWLAIVMPFTYRRIKPKHTRKVIALVWVVGATINLSTLFRAKFNKATKQCTWIPLSVGNKELPWLDFTLQCVIPFSSMIIIYSHILYTLKRHAVKAFPGRRCRPLKRLTKMTLAASSAMIIGWLPSRVSFMLSKFGYVDPNGVLHYCLVMLAVSNSCVNPFIYNMFNRQFRNDCEEVLRNLFSLCKNSTKQRSTEKNINGKENAIFRLPNVQA